MTDDVLTMHDESGKPIGKPYSRKESDASDFNRPLRYRPLGIA
ncbi:hypothetical protein [Bradyrhizobium sp. sBnM-33]|nr:hypothetical protein [Bradyrhizobium sp. sBnM-33]WOH47611.1 hypothetical protein RX328_25955 [Bradyrhizobium sp. sBnM-33]